MRLATPHEPVDARQQPPPPALQSTAALSRTAGMRSIAAELREAHSHLEEATRRQRDAHLEWECLRTSTAKRAKARAADRCRRLRKRIAKLHEQQTDISEAYAPRPVNPRPGEAAAAPSYRANPGSSNETASAVRPVPGGPAPRPLLAATDIQALLAQVLDNLRTLVRTSSDPATALTAMDAILAALVSILQPSDPRHV